MSAAYQFHGLDHLPTEGGLLIPSRLPLRELIALEKKLPNTSIAYLAEDTSSFEPELEKHVANGKTALAFSVNELDLAPVAEQLTKLIAEKNIIIYLPGKRHSFAGAVSDIPGKTLEFLADLGLPTNPIYVEFSRNTRLSAEAANQLPVASFEICPQLSEPDRISAAAINESLHAASNQVFERRALLNGGLAAILFSSLKRHGANRHWHDGSDDSSLAYDKMLAVAIALSRRIQRSITKNRVGVILPPGKASAIANLAIVFAGKTPVNFNFTASREAVLSAMRQSGVEIFLTADPFVRKVPDFPWPPNRDLWFIERILPELQKSIKRWFIALKVIPSGVLARRLELDERQGNDEAVLLFTSGSSGEPKGVPLTHRNLIANVHQFATRLQLPPQSKMLACLPLFHSFGITVTLWYPLIEGIDVVSYPSPLDSKRLADLIETHRISLLLATPTFLRGYMRRIPANKLSSLKIVVTGAEKLPNNLADSFAEKFGVAPMEGYGLTETSPVTNFNLPNPEPTSANKDFVLRHRQGSVGRFVAGMAVKILNPATDQPLPIDQSGIICLKGPNVFEGYLNNHKKTSEVIRDGWFITGDVGFVDSDGFLHIEGRISRFSKIGGEMVPHEKLEATINELLELDREAERRIAIVGVPDEQKGESIILLSTLESRSPQQEVIDLRYKLRDAGIPSLWCPKTIKKVAEIPVLASGKLDIKKCEQLANE